MLAFDKPHNRATSPATQQTYRLQRRSTPRRVVNAVVELYQQPVQDCASMSKKPEFIELSYKKP
jgi:hypothetical protein